MLKEIQNTKQCPNWNFKRNKYWSKEHKAGPGTLPSLNSRENVRRPLQEQERGGGKQDARTTHIFKRNCGLSWLCSCVPSFASSKAADWNSSLANAPQKCQERIYTTNWQTGWGINTKKEVKWCLWVKTDTGTASGKARPSRKSTPTPAVGFCSRTAGTQTVVCTAVWTDTPKAPPGHSQVTELRDEDPKTQL